MRHSRLDASRGGEAAAALTRPTRTPRQWRWPIAKTLDLQSFNVVSRHACSVESIHKIPCGTAWNRTATSAKVLRHVDEEKLPVGASIVLDVANPCVHC